MKSKILIIAAVLLLVFFAVVISLISGVSENKLYAKCQGYTQVRDWQNGSICYEKLSKRYKKNEYKFRYALTLAGLSKFLDSSVQLELVIKNEKKDLKLVENAKKVLETLLNQNQGDYLSSIEKPAVWEFPQKLDVYIAPDDFNLKTYKKAFATWDEALGYLVGFNFVDEVEGADIICASKDILPDEAPKGSAGVATSEMFEYSQIPNQKFMKRVNIYVLERSPVTNERYPKNKIFSVALHEIGHALGITGHSEEKHDIMYKDDSANAQVYSKLSRRDINTVKKLYNGIMPEDN